MKCFAYYVYLSIYNYIIIYIYINTHAHTSLDVTNNG